MLLGGGTAWRGQAVGGGGRLVVLYEEEAAGWRGQLTGAAGSEGAAAWNGLVGFTAATGLAHALQIKKLILL